jgi:Ti-type conjugative transfer relaxase TraA
MLSISAPLSGAGQGDYYLDLAREDYYLKGGEPPGGWFGKGASDLGLFGEVKREDLHRSLLGFDCYDNPLVQNAGSDVRQSGWDLTFSAPKSVSVVWSQGSEEVRSGIQQAHDQAVKKALSYLEDHATVSRRGKEGRIKEPVGMTAALFQHGTSRAQEPQLHTHAVVMNLAVRSDGTTGTIESRGFFAHKMAAGALYRAELSAQLEKNLGLQSHRERGWFELSGVSESLSKEFSSRREAVEERLKELGVSTAKASAVAALDTREVKASVSRSKLFEEWHEAGKRHGFESKEVEALRRQEPVIRDPEKERQEIQKEVLTKLTSQQSYFSSREAVRAVAEASQGRGFGADEVVQMTGSLLRGEEIIELGRVKGEERFTTKEMVHLEESLMRKAEQASNRNGIPCEMFLPGGMKSSDEQVVAKSYLTDGRSSLKIVSGMAGTGKSVLLRDAAIAWTQSGQTVYGAALSGKAAQELTNSAGIKSETLHTTLYQIDKGSIAITPKTVLVIDEAGMVGTRQMHALMERVERGGGTLVLVGDAKQLQPIDAGGPFHALTQRFEHATLTEIKRQREEWARGAVTKFAHGEARAALHDYASRGFVSVSDNRALAKESLLESWKERGGAISPEKHLMLAGQKNEVVEINRRAQAIRYAKGEISSEGGRIKIGKEVFLVGDRVLFTKNSRFVGVKNGELGTVEGVNEKTRTLTVKTDRGRIQFCAGTYEDVTLGYAMTTHKSQGATVENTHVLLGGAMQDKELSYVQASRARGNTYLYVDRAEAGKNLSDLASQMSKSRQKDLAILHMEPERKRAEPTRESLKERGLQRILIAEPTTKDSPQRRVVAIVQAPTEEPVQKRGMSRGR